jgi:hypothetical protein
VKSATDKQFDARARAALAQEAAEPEGWWWLSFVGAEGFRGCCLVRARGFLSACLEARKQGCSPGGQVKGVGPVPDDPLPGWANRLLSREECDAFDRAHDEAP